MDQDVEADEPPAWWPPEYRQQFPRWHVWRGIAGIMYARKIGTSPARVVRGESPDDLRGAIVREEADIQAGVWAGITHGSI